MIRKKLYFSVFTLVVCFMLIMLLVYERYIGEEIRTALLLFVNRVLPPLFPYMVISKLIVSLELFAPLNRFLGFGRMFRLPDESSSVIFTGLLCGFPVGASGTCTLYENGTISKKDAERLAALSSNTGPAFIIGTVSSLWNSKAYGIFLYIVQTLSAVVIAKIKSRATPAQSNAKRKYTEPPQKSFAAELCKAVSESASACLTVCAYIVFFRTVAVIFSCLLPFLYPVFSVIFEFSSGCAAGATIGGMRGIFMTGFAVGSAGLSVMMQNYNLLGRHDIPMKTLWISKAVQGFLCGAASVLFYCVCMPKSSIASIAFAEIFSWNEVILSLIILFVLSKTHKISNLLI